MFGLPKCSGSNSEFSRGEGHSDGFGQITFEDRKVKTSIPVAIADARTNEPIVGIRVEFLSDGERLLVVAFDEQGQYIPEVYEGELTSQTSHAPLGVQPTLAQGFIPTILALLDWKATVQTVNDLIGLATWNRPAYENWNWIYHEECWSRDQLKKGVKAMMKGVEVVFPLKSPGGAFEEKTKLLTKAMMIATGEVIDMDASLLFSDLPDPIKLRIYHVPIAIPTLSIQVIGSCSINHLTAPHSGGFGALISKESIPPLTADVIQVGETGIASSQDTNGMDLLILA
jgi:hypothetical protein